MVKGFGQKWLRYVYVLMIRRPPRSPLFPYTTLFRSVIFAGAGERLELTHVATDRRIYARGAVRAALWTAGRPPGLDRKSTRLNSSHVRSSYAVFCLKKKNETCNSVLTKYP